MIVLFDTVHRRRPVREGGELVMLEWETKRVLRSRPLFPTAPDITDDPNPRGNSRGGKGIITEGRDIFVALYHSILVFDADLNETRRIDHPLFSGLHELCLDGDGIWVAATAIDAAIRIGRSGQTQRTWWPREEPLLQEKLGLFPAAIDKGADNRLLHLAKEVSKTPGHVHLNGLAACDGDLYALLNAPGALVQVRPQTRVLAVDPRLRGAHSPQVAPGGGEIAVCSSFHQSVLFIDRQNGAVTREIRLLDFPEVDRLHREHPARPYSASIFVRGLASLPQNRWLVGISPAAVLEFDAGRSVLLGLYVHSGEVGDAVHGLAVLPDPVHP